MISRTLLNKVESKVKEKEINKLITFTTGVLWTRGHAGEDKKLHARRQRQAVSVIRGRRMRQDFPSGEERGFDE